MTLTQLIAKEYDIDCSSEDEVKQVVEVLNRNKVKENMIGNGGTVVWLYKTTEYTVTDRLSSIGNTISAHEFLNLAL
jgi:hypothetical protein